MIVAVVLATVGGLFPVWVDEEIPGWVKWLLTLALAALFAWLVTQSVRAATVADASGLHVRGLMRTRRLTWSEIQDIRVEANHGAAMNRNAPRLVSYAYGPNGGRVQLMYVDDSHVDLEREVGFLRRVWEEQRGDAWAPDDGVANRIGQGEARRLAVMSGISWAMLSLIPLTLLMLLTLFTKVPDALEGVLTPWVVMGVGVPGAFFLGMLLSYRREHRTG
ncbi:PH domain-containing protein [Streptomyces sp. I4(2020)]|uniref:PH domain-containing protein n=1 Tax=Streptomyces sp. I4(2020) TaxID=2760981 RepID=UPI0018EEA614|nr:PH domain-containing protein [Streptomyces sp. I4(2020)]MBJ6613784.1 PH domain-containing protein [Streptomyces sp. I3(2020)]MBJ6628864.1 PH domain-containing protein [Streptomyces sp. I4(2020)]